MVMVMLMVMAVGMAMVVMVRVDCGDVVMHQSKLGEQINLWINTNLGSESFDCDPTIGYSSKSMDHNPYKWKQIVGSHI